MTNARSEHSATLLPSGKVLVVGGRDFHGGSGTSTVWASAELYDPQSGTWSSAGQLDAPRFLHTATLLPSGKVLITGGENTTSTPVTTSQVYDPVTGAWSLATAPGNTPGERFNHTATLLPSGKVLAAGGQTSLTPPIDPLSSVGLYEAVTSWPENLRPRVNSISISRSSSLLELTVNGDNLWTKPEGSSGNHQSSVTNTPVITLRAVDGSGEWPLTLTEFSRTVLKANTTNQTDPDPDPDQPFLPHYLLVVRVNTLSSGGIALLDPAPPAAPRITLPIDGGWVNTATPRFEGSAEPLAVVTLTEDSHELGSIQATDGGIWSIQIQPGQELTETVHTVKATATDWAGNSSPHPTSVTFEVDTTRPPSPEVRSPSNGARLNTQHPTFHGTTEPFSTVSLRNGATSLGSFTAGDGGTWQIVSTESLDEGSHTVLAEATDRANNTSLQPTSVT
ncbi:MAG TPA: Ig-like domain-containing protein, partial [Hyalangium sp.]|nr:Ig-like domain-containing protein [Hyalangium sp.]